MSEQSSLSIRKPVSAWNRPLNANFKDLFKGASKAVIHGLTLNWTEAAKSMADALTAAGFEQDPGQTAWLLIHRSLIRAMYDLISENLALIRSAPSGRWNLREKTDFTEDELDGIAQRLDFSLEEAELTIDRNLFERPKELPIVGAMRKPFNEWLRDWGLDEAQSRAISDRLPTYFVYALNEEWIRRPADYAPVKAALDTPFTRANQREQAWSRYNAWLQKQIEEPMFGEAFSLKQVYIMPRAYFERRVDGAGKRREERDLGKEPESERVVVDLAPQLEAWVNNEDARPPRTL